MRQTPFSDLFVVPSVFILLSRNCRAHFMIFQRIRVGSSWSALKKCLIIDYISTGASGRIVPKRPAGLPVSPVTSAEELRHVPAPVLPSTAELEAHTFSHLPFRSWCSACVRALGHRRVDAKTKEAEQFRWTAGSLGNLRTEHMTHFHCSSCEISRVKASGVTRCRRRV